MEQSILNTIKKMLGVDSSYDAFDTDIIVAINTAIFTLTQVGVGPEEGFTISGADETWTDFLGDVCAGRLQQRRRGIFVAAECQL